MTPSANDQTLPKPDPMEPVLHEECYYRKDKELIERSLHATDKSCLVFFGLRRYGKTCFLHRIERLANSGVLRSPTRSFKADLIMAGRDASTTADLLSRIVNEIEDDESDDAPCRLVLFDDIQELSKKKTTDMLHIENIRMQMGRLLKYADSHKGRAKLILCEPTYFHDWLCDENDKVGQVFQKLLFRYAVPSQDYILPPLSYAEAQDLLTAKVNGKARIAGVSVNLSNELCIKFGGNPWLLAYASQALDGDKRTIAEITHYVFEQTSHGGLAEERLSSIYGSLSKAEQFFIRLVYDAERNPSGLAANYLTKYHDKALTDTGKYIAQMLPSLGIIKGQPETGYFIIPIIREYLGRIIKNYSIERGGHPQDKEVWEEVLTVPQPDNMGKHHFVIHQLSDLMLDTSPFQVDAGPAVNHNSPWTAYTSYLKELDKESRPDVIVVCGNTIALPYTLDDADQEAHRENYVTALNAVRSRLVKLKDFLKPKWPEVEPSLKQIVLLPGIFDLDWAANGDVAAAASQWRSTFVDFSTGTEAYRDDTFHINIFPFDTVCLNGALEHEQSVEDLREVRANLQRQFVSTWEYLVNNDAIIPEIGDNGDAFEASRYREAASRFARLTMNYIVRTEHDQGTRISDPTYLYRDSDTQKGGSSQAAEPAHFAADTGYVSSAQLEWLQPISDAGDPSASKWISIAVTHHHPHLRRRGGVIELYDGHDFRQTLVKAGVRYVLHGHSDCQQVLSEKVDRVGYNAASRTLSLVGSGSFTSLGGILNSQEAVYNCLSFGAPSFNCIEISRTPEPPQGTEPIPANVKVHFMEWNRTENRIIESGVVNDTIGR